MGSWGLRRKKGPMATRLKYVSAGQACGCGREVTGLISLVCLFIVSLYRYERFERLKFHDICISDLNQY